MTISGVRGDSGSPRCSRRQTVARARQPVERARRSPRASARPPAPRCGSAACRRERSRRRSRRPGALRTSPMQRAMSSGIGGVEGRLGVAEQLRHRGDAARRDRAPRRTSPRGSAGRRPRRGTGRRRARSSGRARRARGRHEAGEQQLPRSMPRLARERPAGPGGAGSGTLQAITSWWAWRSSGARQRVGADRALEVLAVVGPADVEQEAGPDLGQLRAEQRLPPRPRSGPARRSGPRRPSRSR